MGVFRPMFNIDAGRLERSVCGQRNVPPFFDFVIAGGNQIWFSTSS